MLRRKCRPKQRHNVSYGESTVRFPRREFLQAVAAPLAIGQTMRRPRVAAIVTTYHWWSHADVVVGRLLAGCSPNGKWQSARCNVSTLYTAQIHKQDMSADLAARHGFRICASIDEAIGSDIDAVVFIGEHGDYLTNELGQKLYPRYELFSQILDVYERQGRALPTFFDKHFSYSWPKAKEMFARTRRLGVPLLAGSSIPLSIRVPQLIPRQGIRYEGAICLGYGDPDAYGFHTLEALQCMLERRSGGETGVKAVEFVTGPGVWPRVSEEGWDDLVSAAMATIPSAAPREQAKSPVLFALEYSDGLRAACLLLNGALEDWAFAGKAGSAIHACKFGPARKTRPLPHFDGLAANIEDLFLTGKPAYPAERTLLTTGILAHLFDSKASGKRVETPELAMRYAAPKNPYVQSA